MGKKRPPKKPAAKKKPDLAHIVPDLRGLAVEAAGLSLDEQNARAHDEANLAAIAASLDKFGQRKPLVVDGSGRVIAGNGTLLAARSLEWTHVAVVRVSDDPAAARGYAIADNRTSDLSNWDLDALLVSIDAIAEDDPDLYAAMLLDDLRPAPPSGNPDGTEYDESCANDVQLTECPSCGHTFPK